MCSGRAVSPALAPMHQRVLGAVGDPDFGRAGRRDGRGQPVPVGMIGDHQRQFDTALAGPGPHPHPARREGRRPDRESAATTVVQSPRRADHDGAGKVGLGRVARQPQRAEIHAGLA